MFSHNPVADFFAKGRITENRFMHSEDGCLVVPNLLSLLAALLTLVHDQSDHALETDQ